MPKIVDPKGITLFMMHFEVYVIQYKDEEITEYILDAAVNCLSSRLLTSSEQHKVDIDWQDFEARRI